jgi:hypothetical protein
MNKGILVLATKKTDDFYQTTVHWGTFHAWKTQTLNFLEELLPQESIYLKKFNDLTSSNSDDAVESGLSILNNLKEDLLNGHVKLKQEDTEQSDPTQLILNLCNKFHQIIRQMRYRYDGRDTLDVQDEYDVQNLLHALLHLYFDDIRPEEWTPSYAGKSSRMDFLLKKEKIVIEVKKTRKGLTAKELGSQLIEDIERYKSHPDCKKLVCFTYDPEGLIANPRGIENDLNRVDESLTVQVIIHP